MERPSLNPNGAWRPWLGQLSLHSSAPLSYSVVAAHLSWSAFLRCSALLFWSVFIVLLVASALVCHFAAHGPCLCQSSMVYFTRPGAHLHLKLLVVLLFANLRRACLGKTSLCILEPLSCLDFVVLPGTLVLVSLHCATRRAHLGQPSQCHSAPLSWSTFISYVSRRSILGQLAEVGGFASELCRGFGKRSTRLATSGWAAEDLGAAPCGHSM